MRGFSSKQKRTDPLGRLTGMTSGLGAFTFGYEAKSGRLSTVDAALTDATVAALRTSFTYEEPDAVLGKGRRLSGIAHRTGHFVLNSGGIGPFGGSFSDPPTQAEMQAFAAYVESLRAALVRP